MKIEIYEIQPTEQLRSESDSMTCFDTSDDLRKHMKNHCSRLSEGIWGIAIINEQPIKFYWGYCGNDGTIWSNDEDIRMLVKSIVPLWFATTFLR